MSTTSPGDAQNTALNHTGAFFAEMKAKADLATIESEGDRSIEAWFLGPRAENLELFERLVVEAVRDHAYWRRNYQPSDPGHITQAMRQTPEYQGAVDNLETNYREMLAWLKKSVPWFSMRYQGHMNWEVLIPGMLGYFSAMLYNPNNVAFEGSTATTILELLVGDDLCQMLGYEINDADASHVRPWGHITCDGTVANIEALWAARNLKFYPFALAATLKEISSGEAFDVGLPDGSRKPLIALSGWELANLDADIVLAIPTRLTEELGLSQAQIDKGLRKYGLQEMGLSGFSRAFLAELGEPAVLVPGTKHYSFPKAAALLGLGAHNLIDVGVDEDARLDIADLEAKVRTLVAEKRPIIAVVAVMGTTEESALDPLTEVLSLRDKLRAEGITFHVHADAAWGGYHRCVINKPFQLAKPGTVGFVAPPPAPQAPLSAYAVRQLYALGAADSITVDPHKGGYVPYPAGALCYRNGAMRNLVSFSAPVVFHGEAEPTVGIYGVEGSKPGAAPAAVYLAHKVVRPDHTGYGRIISRALYSCRKLYVRLLAMAGEDDPFTVTPLPRLPAERSGGSDEVVAMQRQRVLDLIDQQTNDAILADAEAMSLLQEVGPDQNILSYAFNLRLSDGSVNTDPEVANQLNQLIYRRLSIRPGEDISGYKLIVSTTDIARANYGDRFLASLGDRMGLTRGAEKLTVIRSVVMDPWIVETTEEGGFIGIIEKELRHAVLDAVQALRPVATGV